MLGRRRSTIGGPGSNLTRQRARHRKDHQVQSPPVPGPNRLPQGRPRAAGQEHDDAARAKNRRVDRGPDARNAGHAGADALSDGRDRATTMPFRYRALRPGRHCYVAEHIYGSQASPRPTMPFRYRALRPGRHCYVPNPKNSREEKNVGPVWDGVLFTGSGEGGTGRVPGASRMTAATCGNIALKPPRPPTPSPPAPPSASPSGPATTR
jgi:hypothetical protein